MKKLFPIIILFLAYTLFAKSIPNWVKSRPIDKNYYIGIGVAKKSKQNKDYIQHAKDSALKNLASEISVNISGEVISKVMEKNGINKEELISNIKTSTKAKLQEYELMGTWEDKNNYWAYYRLSKEKYKAIQKQKRDDAARLSLSIFTKAKDAENNKNITKALKLYLQSFDPIKDYITESLQVTYNGKEIYLINEIYSSINDILSKITLKPITPKIDVKINKQILIPIKIKTLYQSDGSEIKIANLPLTFSFIKGSGKILKEARSGMEGIAKSELTQITSDDKLQIIKSELNIFELAGSDTASFVYKFVIKSFSTPYAKVILKTSNLSFYMDYSENNLGKKTNYVEPKLKEALSKKGYSFTDDISKADFSMGISANTRKGSEIYGMSSSFCDVTISLTDLSSGEEIYKNTFENVKGIDKNFEKAGIKSLVEASKKAVQGIETALKGN